MLRGHSIKDTQAALRHDEKTVFAGLYRAPSQATCYRIRRRFRLTGLTTVEPRRGRMPLLCADETRAVRALCEKPGGKKRGYRLSRLAAWLARLVRGDVFDVFFSEHISSRRSSHPFSLRCHEFRGQLDA